jgi:hypothetical protein
MPRSWEHAVTDLLPTAWRRNVGATFAGSRTAKAADLIINYWRTSAGR